MPIWFWIGLLVPFCLVAAALVAGWLTSARADRELRDEERARTESLRPKSPLAG